MRRVRRDADPVNPSFANSAPTPRPQPEAALAHIDRLPTLPAVAIKLLQATSSADSNARDVVAMLRGDQSLTAKILAVAGSAGAAARPVRTLEEAVTMLGFAAVRSVVLAATVFECFRGEGSGPAGAFDRNGFWLHSLAVACAARLIAKSAPEFRIDPEHAYVAGLLHDLGKVALDALFPKAYDRIAQRAAQERADIADLERDVLGIDHMRAGRRLAERWQLPAELRDTLWLHHLALESLPSGLAAPHLIAIVQLADTLAREQRVGYSGNYVFFEHSPRLAQTLGLGEARLDTLATTIVREAREHAGLLGLNREPPEQVYVKAMSDANAELGRINTELSLSNRRLAAAARFFHAISELDRRIGPWADLTTVTAAIADTAQAALQHRCLAAIGVHLDAGGLDIAWRGRDGSEGAATLLELPEECRSWLEKTWASTAATLIPLPHELRRALVGTPAVRESGTLWLAPICDGQRLAGGILLSGEREQSPAIDAGSDDLGAFLNSLGLALSRANAQQAARRLTDDLADTNRRLQHMQVELLRSRALSMIAEMAAGAAHELNTPLTVISGRAQMLSRELPDPEQRRSLEMVRDKAHECSRIVSDLMDFARPHPPQWAPIDLLNLLEDARSAFLQSSGLDGARLRVEPAQAERYRALGQTKPQFMLQADAAMLRGLVDELLRNALDAVSENAGAIAIRCGPAAVADGFEIRVSDSGAGMPPQVQERAFDPFFSFHKAGRRRGLGLARALRIVEAHRGRIWLESAEGRGTTVHVILPRRQPAAAPSAAASTDSLNRPGS